MTKGADGGSGLLAVFVTQRLLKNGCPRYPHRHYAADAGRNAGIAAGRPGEAPEAGRAISSCRREASQGHAKNTQEFRTGRTPAGASTSTDSFPSAMGDSDGY